MKTKGLKLPLLIIALGIVASIICCLLTCITKVPTVKEYEFNYSVSYKLGEKTKTLDCVYKCSFDSDDILDSPRSRYYTGEYKSCGLSLHDSAFTVAKKDGLELAIAVNFNNSYLMGDIENDFYDDNIESPYLLVYDQDGICYDDPDMIGKFESEIIDWKYPEPIENTFVFGGFSRLYEESMLYMIFIGILVFAASLIIVKKDSSIEYSFLDKIGFIINLVMILVVFPVLTLLSRLIQEFSTGPDFIYQAYLCVPVIILLSIAASVSFRRLGYTKSGLFIQFTGPAIFTLLTFSEYVL